MSYNNKYNKMNDKFYTRNTSSTSGSIRRIDLTEFKGQGYKPTHCDVSVLPKKDTRDREYTYLCKLTLRARNDKALDFNNYRQQIENGIIMFNASNAISEVQLQEVSEEYFLIKIISKTKIRNKANCYYMVINSLANEIKSFISFKEYSESTSGIFTIFKFERGDVSYSSNNGPIRKFTKNEILSKLSILIELVNKNFDEDGSRSKALNEIIRLIDNSLL